MVLIKPMPPEEECPHCRQRQRSGPQHRRFFALCRALYENWPERHAVTGEAMNFVPESEEQLRKYLTVKVGYRKVTIISIPRARNSMRLRQSALESAKIAAAAALRAGGDFPFVEVVGTSIEIMVATSIRWDRMGHKKFTKLSTLVDEEVLALTGMPVSLFLPELHVRASHNHKESEHDEQVYEQT